MRIVVVSPYDPYPDRDTAGAHVGGVERMLAAVSERMAAKGHEVTIVCSSASMSGASPPGVRVIRVRRRGTLLRAPITRLVRHIPYGADVIHVPATYPFTTPSVLRYARRNHIPCVMDFHFEPEPGSWFGRLAARAYRAIGPRTYRHADAVLVRSMAYAERCPSLAAIPTSRLHALPNGIDPRRFQSKGDPIHGGPLLFVGRLVPYKGLAVLFDALASMPAPPPLWIVGDGPLRNELERKAKRLRIDVTFHGRVPDAALPAYYQRSACTVLPSVTGQECFGIALLESMACGTPVVASALPGVAEVGALGGPTATPGDATALATAIQQALRSAPGGPTLAQIVHDKYSWDAVTDRLLTIYERLIGTHVPPLVTYAHPRSDPLL